MAKQKKISFLIAAHNEEKIIEKTLRNLFYLPYDNYEVVVGLDGCEDKTEEIVKKFVKKSKKFRYYRLELRKGKPAVINSIIRHARGEIIIINDADWLFKSRYTDGIKKLMRIFEDEKVGGVAECFPVQYESKKGNKSLLELGVTESSFLWMRYVQKKYSEKYREWKVLKKDLKFPLLVNIFRKKLYRENEGLGDDFERCIDILKRGYLVVELNDPKMPRMYSHGEKITLKNLIKQKKRTSLARKQINQRYSRKYSLGAGFYFFSIKEFFQMRGYRKKAGLFLWAGIFAVGNIINFFSKDKGTTEGWKLRLSR